MFLTQRLPTRRHVKLPPIISQGDRPIQDLADERAGEVMVQAADVLVRAEATIRAAHMTGDGLLKWLQRGCARAIQHCVYPHQVCKGRTPTNVMNVIDEAWSNGCPH